jgi:hypothetical protein
MEMRTVNEVYSYKPHGHGIQARCGVQVFETRQRDVLVLTELPDNPGMSVTNYSEGLVTELLARHERLNPQRLAVIEHYPASSKDDETHDHVICDFRGRQCIRVSWRRLTRREVDRLIGEPWPGFFE